MRQPAARTVPPPATGSKPGFRTAARTRSDASSPRRARAAPLAAFSPQPVPPHPLPSPLRPLLYYDLRDIRERDFPYPTLSACPWPPPSLPRHPDSLQPSRRWVTLSIFFFRFLFFIYFYFCCVFFSLSTGRKKTPLVVLRCRRGSRRRAPRPTSRILRILGKPLEDPRELEPHSPTYCISRTFRASRMCAVYAIYIICVMYIIYM